MRFLALLLVAAANPCGWGQFGTTVAISSGLRGDIYLVKPGSEFIPNFKKQKPVGTVYTTSLQIYPRGFEVGFPGITDRFEWFGIDYSGRVWIDQPGRYRFRLLSDDGAKLSLNDSLVIDNDGLHAPITIEGSAELTRGAIQVRVSYFQGPRHSVALVLSVAGPNETEWRIFDTNQFQPPADQSEWPAGKVSAVKRGANW